MVLDCGKVKMDFTESIVNNNDLKSIRKILQS